MAHQTYKIFHDHAQHHVFLHTIETVDRYTTMAKFVGSCLPSRDMNDVPVSIATAALFFELETGCKLSREDRERSVIESYGESVSVKKLDGVPHHPWAYHFIETDE